MRKRMCTEEEKKRRREEELETEIVAYKSLIIDH